MAFVVKVKVENTLRRLTIEREEDGSPSLNFLDIVTKIREMFHISLDQRLELTYIDQDNDLVTMLGDDDLHDAWFIQNLNPLRLHVKLGNLRIQELMDALNEPILSNSDMKSRENQTFFSSPMHNRKEETSTADNQWLKEMLSHKAADGVDAYVPSFQAKSTLSGINQQAPQFSCRYSMDGRMRKILCSSYGCKYYPQMLQRRFQHGVSSIGKLDARFVRDITIFDGTEILGGTCFTKIWRLRNVGTCPWPPATVLVQTGGDFSGTRQSASVQIPKEGLPREEEVNIATDFVAPAYPGCYVSHWRLQAPSGQKFGQRIWVLIKVIPKCMDSDMLNTSNKTALHRESLDNDVHDKNIGLSTDAG